MRCSCLCSVFGSRKLAFGKSPDGEGGVLPGGPIWAQKQLPLPEFPGGAGYQDSGMGAPEKQMA